MLGSRLTRLLLLVFVSACDPADDGMSSFGDRTFLSESVEGHTLVFGTRVTMRFHGDGAMSASAGCNSISSEAYELSDGTLVTGELAGTEKGCDAELHEQDDWLQAFLQASPTYELDEPRLTLVDESVSLVLLDREVADPDRSLQGRTWTVDGLIMGDGVGFGPAAQPATLEFGDDGDVVIMTPCAPGSAKYEVEGASLLLSQVTITDVACPTDENAELIDQHMREVLVDGTCEHQIEAARLTVMRGDIGLSLTTD